MRQLSWRDVPVGIVKNDELLARCVSLATLRPDFIEAFGALLMAENLELYHAWEKVKPHNEQPQMIVTRLMIGE